MLTTGAFRVESGVSNGTGSGSDGRSEQLLAQLADELSLLVRADLELAAAERLHALRRLTVELLATGAAAIAAVFALAGLSWAAVAALDTVLPPWAGPLVVAAAWLAAALALLALDQPRRLARRLRREHHERVIDSQRQQRQEAEDELRETAERLVHALLAEAATRSLEHAAAAARHGVEHAERDAEDILAELVAALTAPGRLGLELLDRLLRADSH